MFFRRFADEAKLNPPGPSGVRSRQGHYVVSADGTLLAAHNRRGARALRELLERALERFVALPAASTKPALEPLEPAPRSGAGALPANGLALNVYTRISAWRPGALEGLAAEFARWNRERTGLDHLWIWPNELRALLPPPEAPIGERLAAPRALVRRIARFHLVDDVRGEPDHYGADDVEDARLLVTVLENGPDRVTLRLDGLFALATSPRAAYPHWFVGTLEGRAVFDRRARRWRRFDMLAGGSTCGESRWAPGAPKGPYELRVAFEVAGAGPGCSVEPQGMRLPARYRRP